MKKLVTDRSRAGIAGLIALLLGAAVIQISLGAAPSSAATSATKALCGTRALPFEKFAPSVSVICDEKYMYVSSNGIASHSMMVGITGWNQQVPLPMLVSDSLTQMWRFPLKPVAAASEIATTGVGGTGIMLNGISNFNATKPAPNSNGSVYSASADPKLQGELDTCAGHSGRGDDYHYHAEPSCLIALLGSESALAGYQLDGYPIYGSKEPSGSVATGLDKCQGHDTGDGRGYHYHFTTSAPYSPMCFHGEVPADVSTTGQPNAGPARSAGEPAQVLITGMTFNLTGTSKLEYTYQGKAGSVSYTPTTTGCWSFVYVNPPPGAPGSGTSSACRRVNSTPNTTPSTTPNSTPNSTPSTTPSAKPSAAPTKAAIVYKNVSVTQVKCSKGKTIKTLTASKCPTGYKLISSKTTVTKVPVPPAQAPTPPTHQPSAQPSAQPSTQPSASQGGQQGGQTNGAPTSFETVVKSSDGTFALKSASAIDEGTLPVAYTCDGKSLSPQFSWSGAPVGTKSYALIMHTIPGPARPGESAAAVSYSWVLYNIPASTTSIAEGASNVGTAGVQSHGAGAYGAPCSQGPGVKQYTFTVYALSSELSLDAKSATGDVVRAAIKSVTLASAAMNVKASRG